MHEQPETKEPGVNGKPCVFGVYQASHGPGERVLEHGTVGGGGQWVIRWQPLSASCFNLEGRGVCQRMKSK